MNIIDMDDRKYKIFYLTMYFSFYGLFFVF